jgi:hypothetical protein
MLEPEAVLAVVRELRPRLELMLPEREAAQAGAQLDALLERADGGDDVTAELLDVLRARDATRDETFRLLRGERGYQPQLGVPADMGGRYACPVARCPERGDRLDDSEPIPRCPTHAVLMQRL